MTARPNQSAEMLEDTARKLATIFATMGWQWSRGVQYPDDLYTPGYDEIVRFIRHAVNEIETDRRSGNPGRTHYSSGRISVDRESAFYDPEVDVCYSVGISTEIGNLDPGEVLP